VGRRAGEDLDVALALEVAERAGQIATDPPVELPHPLVEFLPEVGELDDLVVALTGEVLAALRARAQHVLAIEGELLLELGRGELLGQHGRQVDAPPRRDPIGHQPMQDLEQRQVAFERGFAQPVAAMRPPSVVDHHRKMGMEDECKRIAHQCVPFDKIRARLDHIGQ